MNDSVTKFVVGLHTILPSTPCILWFYYAVNPDMSL